MKRAMTLAGVTEGERAEALGLLYRAVGQALERGDLVPCVAAPDLWLSEDSEDQQAAAYRCGICPVLESCGNYIDGHEEVAGVWAGRTPSDRKQRREGTDR